MVVDNDLSSQTTTSSCFTARAYSIPVNTQYFFEKNVVNPFGDIGVADKFYAAYCEPNLGRFERRLPLPIC